MSGPASADVAVEQVGRCRRLALVAAGCGGDDDPLRHRHDRGGRDDGGRRHGDHRGVGGLPRRPRASARPRPARAGVDGISETPSACHAESLVFAVSAASPTLDPATLNQAASTFIQAEPRRSSAAAHRATTCPASPSSGATWARATPSSAITLRDGVTFSDGAGLTAEGVRRTSSTCRRAR